MPFFLWCDIIKVMKRKVYLDNAATTKLSKKALEAMMPYLTDSFENPSGVYEGGVLARGAVNRARREIANSLKVPDREIIFTAGGSEADNLAIIGVALANKDKGKHIVTTNIEHHAVLNACRFLEREGFRVTYVKVGKNGIVDPEDIKEAITEDTILVSVMFANNEIGTLQPIKEIGEICKERGVLLHTDAVQAYAKVDINPMELNVDLLSASGHKFNGPKGVGFLYVKKGVKLQSIIYGGSQEFSLRGGTENVSGIVGMAEASKEAFENLEKRALIEKEQKDYLLNRILKEIPEVCVNGDLNKSLPSVFNLWVKGVNGDSLLITLDMKGICASTGSACAISLEEPSHVIKALGRSDEEAKETLRISLSFDLSYEDLDYFVDCLKESVSYLRSIRV